MGWIRIAAAPWAKARASSQYAEFRVVGLKRITVPLSPRYGLRRLIAAAYCEIVVIPYLFRRYRHFVG